MNGRVFAARLKEWRERNNLTQEELARMFGTTKQTLSRWETLSMSPRVGKIPDMAETMGVSEEWLAGYNVPEEPEKQTPAGVSKVVLMIPRGELLTVADLEALRWAGEIMARKHIAEEQ